MRRLLLACLSLVVALALAEVAVRSVVRVDGDGQRWVGDRRVRPWRLPLTEIENRIAQLDDPASLFVYDADLGWAPRPGARSRDGLVSIDDSGARRSGEGHAGARPLRIVAVGDSFTFGDEVRDADTWPAQLAELLNARGRAAEVINLGVNGYGTDQAVLRFERDGMPLEPDVVILGFQPENLLRNVNVLRPYFFPGTSLPLSKPRFVLEGDGLRVINQPTVEPSRVLEILRNPGTSSLLEHERWFDDRYVAGLGGSSVLLGLAGSALASAREEEAYRLTPEIAAIAVRAVDRLGEAAAAVGARMTVVHLPRRDDLTASVDGRALWYGAVLEEIGRRHLVVRPELELAEVGDELFAPGGHYAPRYNREVAQSLQSRF